MRPKQGNTLERPRRLALLERACPIAPPFTRGIVWGCSASTSCFIGMPVNRSNRYCTYKRLTVGRDTGLSTRPKSAIPDGDGSRGEVVQRVTDASEESPEAVSITRNLGTGDRPVRSGLLLTQIQEYLGRGEARYLSIEHSYAPVTREIVVAADERVSEPARYALQCTSAWHLCSNVMYTACKTSSSRWTGDGKHPCPLYFDFV
jgi:hypothetical protein